MSRFIRVMNKKDENDIGQEELIRVDDLIKIAKWNGEGGTEIGFEFNDRTRGYRQQWIYDCGSTYRRDILFDNYEEMLGK